MWYFVYISTLKKSQEHQNLSAANPREFQCMRRKNRSALRKKSYLQKKSFGSQKTALPTAILRARQPPHSQPWCRFYTAHTHTRGTFPCLQQLISTRRAVFCRDFLGILFVLPILEPSFFFVAGAACIGNRLYLQHFIFCARSADRDRICALFSTLTPNLSLFTAFSASNGEQSAECLRLFQVILIDVSRETRIFLAIFSIIRAVHYSS